MRTLILFDCINSRDTADSLSCNNTNAGQWWVPKPHFWAQNGPKFQIFKYNKLEMPLIGICYINRFVQTLGT